MKAIEELNRHEKDRSLMMLAATQERFIAKYSVLIPDDRYREDFARELTHLVHMIYREAQQPLVEQLTNFVMTQQRPIIIEKLR